MIAMGVKTMLCALFCLTFLSAKSQQTAEKQIRETRYLLYLPDGYREDTGKRWPPLLFLHGSGESGDNPESVKTNGPPKLIAEGKKFPFIVISPQAPAGEEWEPAELYHFLEAMKQKYRVDNRRIYLSGLSMGGFGAWALAIAHPEEFAAVIPVSGGGDTARVWRLRYMPVWGFHGGMDTIVPLKGKQK
jgi:predicted peptidase